MKPTAQLTHKDVQSLRRKKAGTNGKSVSATEQEVKDTKTQLETLYSGTIYMAFAEKICLRNKEY